MAPQMQTGAEYSVKSAESYTAKGTGLQASTGEISVKSPSDQGAEGNSAITVEKWLGQGNV